jgi:hypothetical protein
VHSVDKKLAEPIIDWEAIVYKGVRTIDGVELGNVVQVDNKEVVTIQGVVHEKEFILPHTVVAEFNGAEVRLNITYEEAKKFLTKLVVPWLTDGLYCENSFL